MLCYVKPMLNQGISFILIAIFLNLTATLSYAACEIKNSSADQSLVFTIDISTSVDADEVELQLMAYETTLRNRAIQDKLLGCGCTELSVVLFAGGARVVVEPTKLVNEADIHSVLNFFSETINTKYTERYLSSHFGLQGNTSVLEGLQTSMDLLLNQDNHAFRKAMLVSGDGVNSQFAERELIEIREVSEYQGIEISGVAINSEDGLCGAYQTDGDLVYPGTGGACSREPVPNSNGLEPLMQRPSQGREYDSVASFYEEFVTNSLGMMNTANTFEDLAETLRSSVDSFACKPMM